MTLGWEFNMGIGAGLVVLVILVSVIGCDDIRGEELDSMCSLWSKLFCPTSVWPVVELSSGKSPNRFELMEITSKWPGVVGYKWCRIGICEIAKFLTVEEGFVEFILSTYGKINSLNTCLEISFPLSSRHL